MSPSVPQLLEPAKNQQNESQDQVHKVSSFAALPVDESVPSTGAASTGSPRWSAPFIPSADFQPWKVDLVPVTKLSSAGKQALENFAGHVRTWMPLAAVVAMVYCAANFLRRGWRFALETKLPLLEPDGAGAAAVRTSLMRFHLIAAATCILMAGSYLLSWCSIASPEYLPWQPAGRCASNYLLFTALWCVSGANFWKSQAVASVAMMVHVLLSFAGAGRAVTKKWGCFAAALLCSMCLILELPATQSGRLRPVMDFAVACTTSYAILWGLSEVLAFRWPIPGSTLEGSVMELLDCAFILGTNHILLKRTQDLRWALGFSDGGANPGQPRT